MKIQKCGLEDINTVVGRQLASVLFPVVGKSAKKLYSLEQNQFNYAIDLVDNLVYDPRYKLINIKSSPNTPRDSEAFNSDSWQALINDVTPREKTKSKGSLLIARGPDHPEDFPLPFRGDSHIFNNYHRSVSLLQNNQKFVSVFDMVIERCTKMATEKAFLYQYEKYGLEMDDFVDYMAIMQNIQNHYLAME